MSDDQDKKRSAEDAQLEREIRQGRKFTAREAMGRMLGPGAMKGGSAVSRVQLPRPACRLERQKLLQPEIMATATALMPALLRRWIMSADDFDAKKKSGFGKPPTHSRWKPGQCGNPRGRPKGALNFTTEVKLMLGAPIVVNDKGKPKRVTTLKAALLRLREMALKGNPRCLAIFLDHAARYGGFSTEPPSDISEDDQAILDAYREEIRAEQSKGDPGSGNDDAEDSK